MASKPNETNPLRIVVQQTVAPLLESRVHSVPGTITKMYDEPMCADVEVMVNGARTLLFNVPISNPKGFIDSWQNEGEKVWVSFNAGGVHTPLITGKFNMEYSAKTDANTNRSAVADRSGQSL
jgi:hypothetical protein